MSWSALFAISISSRKHKVSRLRTSPLKTNSYPRRATMLKIREGEQKSKLWASLKIVRHFTAFCKGSVEKMGRWERAEKAILHAEKKKDDSEHKYIWILFNLWFHKEYENENIQGLHFHTYGNLWKPKVDEEKQVLQHNYCCAKYKDHFSLIILE